MSIRQFLSVSVCQAGPGIYAGWFTKIPHLNHSWTTWYFVETVCNLIPELDVKFEVFAIVTTLNTYICRDTPHDIRTSAKKHTSTMIHIYTRYVRLSWYTLQDTYVGHGLVCCLGDHLSFRAVQFDKVGVKVGEFLFSDDSVLWKRTIAEIFFILFKPGNNALEIHPIKQRKLCDEGHSVICVLWWYLIDGWIL